MKIIVSIYVIINQIITRPGTDLGRTVEEMLFKISLETWFIIFLILY